MVSFGRGTPPHYDRGAAEGVHVAVGVGGTPGTVLPRRRDGGNAEGAQVALHALPPFSRHTRAVC